MTPGRAMEIRRSGVLLAAMLLVASACGASDAEAEPALDADEEVTGETLDVAADGSEADDSAMEEEQADEGNDESSDLIVAEEPPDLTGLRVVVTNALGGLRLGVDPELELVHEGELIKVRHPEVAGHLVIARASVSNTGGGVATVDEFLAAAKAAGPAGDATGDTIQMLGLQLNEYAFRGEPGVGNPGLFASSFRGMSSNTAWAPNPIADVYLGEAGGGVLAVGVVVEDEADLPALHELLEAVVPTVSLVGSELLAVPTGSSTSFESFGEPEPVTPREVEAGLVQPFSVIEPGSYDLANLSQPTRVDIGDGWFVAPNFPGFVVLADVETGQAEGPGDHDVLFLQGMTGVHPLGAVRHDLPGAMSLQTLEEVEAFLATPPLGLLVSDVQNDASLGGATVVQFDLEVDPEAGCQDDSPCRFVFSPAVTNFVLFIDSGYLSRIWWFADAPDGGLMIAATVPAANADWLDGRAGDLVETIVFGEPSS